MLAGWLAAAAATSLGIPGASYADIRPLRCIPAGRAAAFLVPRGSAIALVASWLGAVPLLARHLMIIGGIFDGLDIRLAPPLRIPVVRAAAALVPVAARARGRGPYPGRSPARPMP